MKRKKCKIDPRLTGLLFSLMLFYSSTVYAQNAHTVKGLVVDSRNESIIGASVRLKADASVGTVTDIDGKFSINVPDNNQTLIISYIGMTTKEINIAEKNQITIVMKEDAIQMSELVVVGYGKQKKESVVGAISQTNGDVLKRAGGVSNIGAALTGNVPGVITMQSTGKPGDEDPQILIRGQSTWNNSSPLVLVDGIERPMNTVEISSVETISVLKDASATAVYGVKGANGVILITTKRGSEGKAVINISANATMKTPSQLPNKLDSYDALSLRNRSIENEMALVPSAWNDYLPQEILNKYRHPANLAESERYPNVDWADVLFNDYAMSYDASVNVSGGTPFVKYFAGGEFLNEGDLFNSFENHRGYRSSYGYTRVNVRSNLDFQLTPTTVLSTNLSGVYGQKETPVIGLDEYAFWGAAYYTPSDAMLPQYSDGTFGYFPPDVSRAINSVEAIARSGQNFITTSRINTDFNLTQDLGFLLKGLSAKATLSYDNEFVEVNRGIDDMYRDVQTKWIDPVTGEVRYQKEYDINTGFDFISPLTWTTRGGNMDNGATYRKIFYQAQLNYAKQIKKHDFTLMGVFNRENYARGSEIPHYREDWVFRTTYNYAKKYFVEFNGAYNGSEKFGPDYRFDFFPSAAAGWMITEEKFMKWSEPVLDMLKLRGSYGKIGDDNVSARWLYLTEWQYAMTAKMGPGDDRSPYTWYRQSKLGNENVRWETAIKTNAGADFSFLNGLVAGSFDYFYDNRYDILLLGAYRAIPSYFGAEAPVANLGKVHVKGFELDLRFYYLFANKLRLWANTDFTHAKDKIIDADNPELLPDYQKGEGKAIGQTTSYVSHGFYNTWDELYASTPQYTNDGQKIPGNYQLIDYNGDGVIDTYDNIPYGFSGKPQNTYNATIGIDWKGFSAFVQFYGVNNVTRRITFNSFPSSQLNVAYDQGSFWSKNNTNADAPVPRRMTNKENYMYGNLDLYDGSYIRLKNVEIAYTFDSKQFNWVKRVGLNSFKLYCNGNNLFLWTHMPDDRESNFASDANRDGNMFYQGAYPTVKRINFGINITL